MSTAIAERPDPEACAHLWNLLLNTVGRRVELYCPKCDATDQDLWPPGGIADLIEYVAGDITVSRGQHSAQTFTTMYVNLQVIQSMSVPYRLPVRPGSMQAGTRVRLSPRDVG